MTKKKLLAKLLILAMTATVPAAVQPSTAQAFSIIGAVVGAAQGSIAANQAKAELKAINDDNEKRNQYFEMMKQQAGVNYDYAMNTRLDSIMYNLSNAIAAVDPSIKDKPYNYFINVDENFNAYCSIGHNMSVNTGAMKLLTNDDELAVVIGHEMGHGQKDHVLKGFEGRTTALVVGGAISGGGGSVLSNIIANISAAQIAASYGKKQEAEADKLSFEYLTHTNYNLGACPAVWQRVIDTYGENEQAFANSIINPSDHDDNKRRRDAYNEQLFEYSNKHVKVENGVVKVNKKDFLTAAPTASMSSAERSYFVAGNLARIYHDNLAGGEVTVDGNTVRLSGKAVITSVDGDQPAQDIADTLKAIK